MQSNATARIRLLEDQLGTTLFERNRRGVVLTPRGSPDAGRNWQPGEFERALMLIDALANFRAGIPVAISRD